MEKVIQEDDNVVFQILARINRDLQKQTERCRAPRGLGHVGYRL